MMEKVKPWRSPRYLEWVRSRPCSHCRTPAPSEAHHIIGIAGGQVGSKAGDQLAVPLCTRCHRNLHNGQIHIDAQIGWLVRTLDAAFHHGVLTEERA